MRAAGTLLKSFLHTLCQVLSHFEFGSAAALRYVAVDWHVGPSCIHVPFGPPHCAHHACKRKCPSTTLERPFVFRSSLRRSWATPTWDRHAPSRPHASASDFVVLARTCEHVRTGDPSRPVSPSSFSRRDAHGVDEVLHATDIPRRVCPKVALRQVSWHLACQWHGGHLRPSVARLWPSRLLECHPDAVVTSDLCRRYACSRSAR
ncbi:hypothetical protein BC834DRAFT_576044 [Gloeopeniophorella convolvens]|nr:hypothetical protein BC834DRAFT_576044 [Gloeopeniophorella convolvens]